MEEDDNTYSCPEVNYCRIIETIQELESNVRVTEDWTEDHKKHIFKYRQIFPDFTKVNEEIEDVEFREKAKQTELLLRNIIHGITQYGTINLKFYLILNKHFKYLCECIYSEDELSNIMRDMGL